jgi:hypothetical protein
MKKLLVLLLATLVIGVAFSGPVHNNGPGISAGDSIEFSHIEEFVSMDLALPSIRITNSAAVSAVPGTFAGNSQGIYFVETLGVSGSIINISKALTATPDTYFGDNGPSQEVIARLGCSKPAYREPMIIT